VFEINFIADHVALNSFTLPRCVLDYS